MLRTLRVLLTLFFLSQSSCALLKGKKIKIQDSEICAVAGSISNGADCTTTNSRKSRELTLTELIQYLEPAAEPPKAPAIFMKAEVWTSIKSTLEEACIALRGLCEPEFMQEVKKVDGNIQDLLKKSKAKALKDN